MFSGLSCLERHNVKDGKKKKKGIRIKRMCFKGLDLFFILCKIKEK